ncbi:uncharacterized protein [Penaeus vannamei]|uniref:uncharacterized protein n=1 Tax=Penaeus vannamei TaxID=6689 RepID=UPI00387F53C3
MSAVRSVDGRIILDHVGVREYWAEYFEQLYQVDPPTVSPYARDVAIPVPDPPISEDPPTLTEVRKANSKLKGGKAAEQFGFTPGKSKTDRILALQVIVERFKLLENPFSRYACGADVEVTESFTYLWSTLHVSRLSDQEVSRRIDLAAGAMNFVNSSIWRCRYLSRRTKLRVFKTLILPVLHYGNEPCVLSSALESRLNAFCNKSLRRIVGYSRQDHVSNRRLHHETGMGPVTCIIRDRQLGLYGYLAHFPVDDRVHQVLSVREILRGGGLWEDLGSCGLGSSIRPVGKN